MAHWQVGDNVQVKVGNTWLDGTVDSVKTGGVFVVDITTSPLPSLSDVGITHPRSDGSDKIKTPVSVKAATNAFGGSHLRIRDPI